MKKLFYAVLFVIAAIVITPSKVYAGCTSRTGDVCASSLGTCVTGAGIYCCTDESSCRSYDAEPGWVPPASSSTTTSSTSIQNKCSYQVSGGCSDSSLPQACLVGGQNYYCCSSAQACTEYPGLLVDVANPNNQNTNDVSKKNEDYYCYDSNGKGINTAIGCIHAIGDQSVFLNEILRWAVGIGGGIAFMLMLYAGFMVMTAQGNPERLKAGQELLTSALAGLVLLIFSVFILKFIGVDILGLGSFGFS